MEYECPKYGKAVMVIEINSRQFKYKIVCPNCVYADWVDSLNLEELKNDNKKIKRS